MSGVEADGGALSEAGAYFHSVLEASQDCMRVLNVDGCVEYMNARGQALFEIERFEANHLRYWPDLWPERAREPLERALAEARAGRVASFRAFCPTARGAPRWWDTVVSPVIGPDGKVERLLATSRDITRELETSAFLDTIVQLLPTALIVKSARDGRYVLINKAAEDMLGLSSQEMIGKDARELFPREAESFAAEDAAVIASGEVVTSSEELITTRARGARYFDTKKFATHGEEGPRHLVALAEDVTDRRAAGLALETALAEAERANRSKSAFLANMSHEIRTPLNGIVAVSDMLAREIDDPRLREMAEIVQTSSVGLARLLSDILDWARIDAGRLEIAPRPCALGEAVSPALRLAQLHAEEKGLAFAADIEVGLDTTVATDPDRLRQILSNLLSNAVKFTAEGSVRLTVACDRSGATPIFTFAVRDTGIGFSEEEHARLFHAFEQADGSITRKFGGSGLGLSISRTLARQMGGDIVGEGQPGEGALFTLTLPLEVCVRETAPAAGQPVAEDTGDHPLSVLLAEDHPVNRRVVELIMAAAGAELVSVENGAEAVEAFAARRFDVVLMDMQMPVMDGLTAVRAIRELEAARGLSRTPVICMTANAMAQHEEASRAAGADLHLPKPVTAERVLSAIGAVLEGEAGESKAA